MLGVRNRSVALEKTPTADFFCFLEGLSRSGVFSIANAGLGPIVELE